METSIRIRPSNRHDVWNRKSEVRLIAGFVALFLVLVVAGCGKFGRARSTAASAMDDFHHRYSSDQFDKIYDTASPEFQKTMSRTDFLKFIANVYRQLGDFKTCDHPESRTNYSGSDAVVTLHYRSKFEKGEADEEFRYAVSGTNATLQRYEIKSTRLIDQ